MFDPEENKKDESVEEPKKDEPKKDEIKKDEPKKDESVEEPKKDESVEEPKKEDVASRAAKLKETDEELYNFILAAENARIQEIEEIEKKVCASGFSINFSKLASHKFNTKVSSKDYNHQVLQAILDSKEKVKATDFQPAAAYFAVSNVDMKDRSKSSKFDFTKGIKNYNKEK